MEKLRVKDFEIKCYRVGSRIIGKPEYMYKIIYHAPNGKEIRLNKEYSRKADAQRHIREAIKIAEMLRAEPKTLFGD